MYVGHFAAGLAIKAREPRAPTWGVLVGVGLLDILFAPFVLAGIERATVTPSFHRASHWTSSIGHIRWPCPWSGPFCSPPFSPVMGAV